MKKETILRYIGGVGLLNNIQIRRAMEFECEKMQLEKLIGKDESSKKIVEWAKEAQGTDYNNYDYVINKIINEIYIIREGNRPHFIDFKF